MQVVIDADTRLVVAVEGPVPGNHNDCTAYRDSGADRACRGAHVIADGGHQGTGRSSCPTGGPATAASYPHGSTSSNRPPTGAARIEHVFAHMKWWNLLHNCRRKRDGFHHTTRGIALMHNLAITG